VTIIKNVFEAFAAVMADVRVIAKDDENIQQRFRFRGIDAVMQAVGPVLRTHGVFIIPTGQELKSETYETRSGTMMRNVTVTMQYRVYGPGGDYFDGVSFGEAADAGDKAVTKAQSVAYRTFLLQALTVPTGDVDPDAVSHERVAAEPVAPVVAAKQQLAAMLKKAGIAPVEAVERFTAVHGGELKSTQDLDAVEEMIRHYAEVTGA